jgi:hypothetical protein
VNLVFYLMKRTWPHTILNNSLDCGRLHYAFIRKAGTSLNSRRVWVLANICQPIYIVKMKLNICLCRHRISSSKLG